jgi:hypothetical protein
MLLLLLLDKWTEEKVRHTHVPHFTCANSPCGSRGESVCQQPSGPSTAFPYFSSQQEGSVSVEHDFPGIRIRSEFRKARDLESLPSSVSIPYNYRAVLSVHPPDAMCTPPDAKCTPISRSRLFSASARCFYLQFMLKLVYFYNYHCIRNPIYPTTTTPRQRTPSPAPAAPTALLPLSLVCGLTTGPFG